MIFQDIILYIWNLFSLWGQSLFILPFKNPDMLWILIPLWLSWFFGEFFQEKEGTSYGNAISNAVIVLWAGVDCLRQTIDLVNAGEIFDPVWIRYALCAVLITYGIIIIIYGTKVKNKVKNFGRIRDVTYAFAILVPVLYNVVPLTIEYLIAAIIFFPIFHYTIQLIDLKAPTPKALQVDEEEQTEYIAKKQQTQNIQQQKQSSQQREQANKSQQLQDVRNQSSQSDEQYKTPPNMSYWND